MVDILADRVAPKLREADKLPVRSPCCTATHIAGVALRS